MCIRDSGIGDAEQKIKDAEQADEAPTVQVLSLIHIYGLYATEAMAILAATMILTMVVL